MSDYIDQLYADLEAMVGHRVELAVHTAAVSANLTGQLTRVERAGNDGTDASPERFILHVGETDRVTVLASCIRKGPAGADGTVRISLKVSQLGRKFGGDVRIVSKGGDAV